MNRKAFVYVNDAIAGTLSETAEGEYQFQYHSLYLQDAHSLAVSLTLPKREAVYTSRILFPFFDGLIPEGWLLDIASKNWKINIRDRMGLLLHLCQDAIGNVSIKEIKDE